MTDITFVDQTTVITAGWLNYTNDKSNFFLVATIDGGCDNTGATNTTTALFNFITELISSGKPGYLPSGTYKITRNLLAFDNGHVDTLFPELVTGPEVIFQVDAAVPGTAGPLLSFTNGTASSGSGNYWRGGFLGAIQYRGSASTSLAYANDAEHGLHIRGTQNVRFGLIYGNKLGGSALYMEEKLYAGFNPDPYHNGLNIFEGVLAEYCSYAIENRNWVGLTHPIIGSVRAIGCRSGQWYGPGTSASVEAWSASACAGYMVDDGTAAASTGGGPSRLCIRNIELDGCQYGFYFNKIFQVEIGTCRVVYRFNNTTANPSDYWPMTLVELAAGVAPQVQQVRGQFFHRLEAGGTLADFGPFFDGNNSNNITDVVFENDLADNTGLGFTQDMLFANPPSSSGRWLIKFRGVPINDTIWKVGCVVRAAAGATIGTTYNTIAAKIVYGTELYDLGSYYDSANGWFVAPYNGIATFSGRITTTPNAAATQMQVGFATAVAGVFSATIINHKTSFTAGLGETTFEVSGRFVVVAGQQYFFVAAQNGGTSTTSAPVSTNADLVWSVVME